MVKPITADTQTIDPLVHEFHKAFRLMLRTKQKAFHIDLRQDDGLGPHQVWNQGCYNYTATFEESPAASGDDYKDKPRQIHLKNVFSCNDDYLDTSNISAGDPVSLAGL